jgi:hypothetical protein
MSHRQVASDATPQPHPKFHGSTVRSTKDDRERVPFLHTRPTKESLRDVPPAD